MRALAFLFVALCLAPAPFLYAHEGDKQLDCAGQEIDGDCRHIKKLKVHIINDLNFGKVVMGKTASAGITINAENGIQTLFGAIHSFGGQNGSAEYEIHGQSGKKFIVYFPDDITLWGNGGFVEPKVSQFTGFIPNSDKWIADTRTIGKFGGDGKAKLWVGGTLNLSPPHGSGFMFGTAHIHVEYLDAK